MIFLKYFDKHSGYQDYTSDADYLRPNVSHCKNDYHVHYGKQLIKIKAKIAASSPQTDYILTNTTYESFGGSNLGGGGDIAMLTSTKSSATLKASNNNSSNPIIDLLPDTIATCGTISPYIYHFSYDNEVTVPPYVSYTFTFDENAYNLAKDSNGNSILLDTNGNVIKVLFDGTEQTDENTGNYLTTNLIEQYNNNNNYIGLYSGSSFTYEKYVKLFDTTFLENTSIEETTNILSIKVDDVEIFTDEVKNNTNSINSIGYFNIGFGEHEIEYTFDSSDEIIGEWLKGCNCLREIKFSLIPTNVNYNLIDQCEIIDTDENTVKKLMNNRYVEIEATYAGDNLGDFYGYVLMDGKVIKTICQGGNGQDVGPIIN